MPYHKRYASRAFPGGRRGSAFKRARWSGRGGYSAVRKPARRYAGYYRRAGFYGRYTGSTTQPEKKFHDINIVDASIAVNGTVIGNSLVGIAQGVTQSTRIGRKMMVVAIGFRFDLELLAATGATAQNGEIVRVILFWDKQCNGTVSTVTDMLASDSYLSYTSLANSGRYEFLLDKTFIVNQAGGAGNGTANDFGNVLRHHKMYKKLKVPIEYSGTAGATSELRTNNFGIMVLSRDGSIAALDGKVRVRFTDS